MPERTYTWTLEGADVDGKKFTFDGRLTIPPGNFPVILDAICR